MWFEESVFYQIYPLGLCGAPRENDGGTEPRILKLLDWVPHIKKLGACLLYTSPSPRDMRRSRMPSSA